jgi:hypothetical protein
VRGVYEWLIHISTHPYAFIELCLIKHRDKVTFTLSLTRYTYALNTVLMLTGVTVFRYRDRLQRLCVRRNDFISLSSKVPEGNLVVKRSILRHKLVGYLHQPARHNRFTLGKSLIKVP